MDKLRFAKRLAFGSFLIGSLLMLLQLIWPKAMGITLLGYYYIWLAFIINCLVAIVMLTCIIIGNQRKESALALLILLLNIPIGLGYADFILNYIY